MYLRAPSVSQGHHDRGGSLCSLRRQVTLLCSVLLHIGDGQLEDGRAEKKGGSLEAWKEALHSLPENCVSINKLPLFSIK